MLVFREVCVQQGSEPGTSLWEPLLQSLEQHFGSTPLCWRKAPTALASGKMSLQWSLLPMSPTGLHRALVSVQLLSMGFLTIKYLWMTTDTAARLKVCVLPALLRPLGCQQLPLLKKVPSLPATYEAGQIKAGCVFSVYISKML